MSAQDRARSRSPSGGIKRSPSPHVYNQQGNTLAVDPSLLAQPGTFSGNFGGQQSPGQAGFDSSSFSQQSLPQDFPGQGNQAFLQSSVGQGYQAQYGPQGAQNLFATDTSFGSMDGQFMGDNGATQNQNYESIYLTPDMLDGQQGSNQFNMATLQRQSIDGPQLLQPEMTQGSSQHNSPQSQHSPFSSQSLDPSSAAYPRNSGEWSGMGFYNHRRTASDQYSDVSSQPSPYLGNADSFEPLGSHSPGLNGQQDPSLMPENLPLGQFSLSDPQLQAPQRSSRGPSPHVSPNLQPQQPWLDPSLVSLDGQYSEGVLFPQQDPMQQQRNDAGEYDHLSPPEVRVDFAPPAKQPSFDQLGNSVRSNALSPPLRSGRNRSRSDPYSLPASARGASPLRNRSPSLGLPNDGLSPNSSRSSSPAPQDRNRRSSTPSVPSEREKLLHLADPSRAPQTNISVSSVGGQSNSGSAVSTTGNRRAQKHPATFQCHLCPKRFTRAYNLRSHLRTHTDERPFVCTLCGKAFARQHDRKRHEGLHSGERRFVCKGVLNGGAGHWGCGRRFARADALGRHFRSEAGRACIKPLLDEEARERQADMMEKANQEMLNASQGRQMQQPIGLPTGAPGMGNIDFSSIQLPAALLQQYPALGSINWDELPTVGGPADEGDFDGRSSFDASDTGDFDDVDGYVSDVGLGYGGGMGVAAGGWASDYGER